MAFGLVSVTTRLKSVGPPKLVGKSCGTLETLPVNDESAPPIPKPAPELSDVSAMSLKATQDGDGYRLSGEKLWISNAPEADIYTVFARTSEGSHGLTAFAVPGDSVGLSGEHKTLLAPHAALARPRP